MGGNTYSQGNELHMSVPGPPRRSQLPWTVVSKAIRKLQISRAPPHNRESLPGVGDTLLNSVYIYARK